MATYAGRYDEPLIRKAGNRLAPPADGTTVLVYESDGSTEATLYTDRTKSTTADNPVEVDASGNIEFFADPGTYVLSIREDGSQVATDTVTVFNDPAETAEGSGAVDSVNGQTGVVVLDADDIDDTSTTNRFATAAELTKLAGIEANATADMTGAEIKTAYEAEADTNAYTDAEKSKLAGVATGATANSSDATLLDRANHTGTQAQSTITDLVTDLAAKADADGEYAVNTVATSGATETLTLAPAHKVTMDQNCTFTFPTPAAGHTFLLWLSGAFTPTFPASVDWDSATAPTYATPSLYGFTTLDGGTTWAGTLIASGLG